MKNFNILGVCRKIWVLRGRGGGQGSQKSIYTIYSGDCLKWGLGKFVDLRGVWQEGRDGVFEGGSWYSDAHYDRKNNLSGKGHFLTKRPISLCFFFLKLAWKLHWCEWFWSYFKTIVSFYLPVPQANAVTK